MKETSITYLKTALREGNTNCLKDIFAAHGDYCIENLINKKGCSREAAEDIFIDALINFRDKILNNKITYITNIRSYIYTTCINMHKANLYQQGRHARNEQDIAFHLYDNTDSDYLSKTVAEEELLQLLEISNKSFQSLDKRCQTILRLFYIYHYSMEEIAQTLKLASKDVAKTSKSRCFKKWSKLVESLREKKG